MRSRLAILTMATALGVSGCASMTTTEQRTLSGAAIGALGGAAIAAVSAGSVATGAAIGTGVGAAAGYIYSRMRDGDSAAKKTAYHPVKRQKVAGANAAKPAKAPTPPAPTPATARTTDQVLASD